MSNKRNFRLKLIPMMWTNSGPANHIGENISRYEIEGIDGAYIDREGDGWRCEIGPSMELEASFNSASDALTALEASLGNGPPAVLRF